jgi:hypothetical protein
MGYAPRSSLFCWAIISVATSLVLISRLERLGERMSLFEAL